MNDLEQCSNPPQWKIVSNRNDAEGDFEQSSTDPNLTVI